MKYKKKPIVIEAVKWTGSNFHRIKDLTKWDNINLSVENDLFIRTLEGHMKADIGDYVIKGIQGEVYPCKPDIFEASYEKVEDDSCAQ